MSEDKIRNRDYVWHCPNSICREKGTILMKTEHPYLGKGEVMCPECKEISSFNELMRRNIKNLEDFLLKLRRG